MTGFTSELDGTIPDLEQKVIGPWIFIRTDDKVSYMDYYILSKEETVELIETSNDWYVNKWNRKLSSKPVVGIDIPWLQGLKTEASKPQAVKQYPEYVSSLKETSYNKWEKITSLL